MTRLEDCYVACLSSFLIAMAPTPSFAAEKTADAQPAVVHGTASQTFVRTRPMLGLRLGPSFVPGALGSDLDTGLDLALFAGLGIPFIPYTRLEASAGFNRFARSAPGVSGALLRVPVRLSLRPELQLNRIITSAAELPTVNLRVGAGVATALVSAMSKANGVDPELHWGLGVRFPIGRLWDDNGTLLRVDAIHGVQLGKRIDNFIGVTVGIELLLVSDRDDDGILDEHDKCPDEPEDMDGDRDDDGCPEVKTDLDGDGIDDLVDKCPNQAEDMDGFQDDDGCPDPDNDGDGIVDANDKCPNDPEDMNGFEDTDGCPDAHRDTDGDGVPDISDKCPNELEDRDGFEDDDGCPDYDNDLDGIRDSADKCPNEPETINGVNDDDGCPDEGATLVQLTKDKIEIKEAVYFETDKDVIMPRSFGLLNQVAAVLKNHAEISRVRVEGHTDSDGDDAYNLNLSQRRANSVRAYLIGQQIDAQRLEAVGFGETRPVASNKTDRGREQNRRVEFVLVQDDAAPPSGPQK